MANRVLILIVAYNAERTIGEVLRRVPGSMANFDTEVLIIDDSSQDHTFEAAHRFVAQQSFPFRITILRSPVNQGYGGNQKLGFRYAIEKGFDAVALLHGDAQYAPECLPSLVQPVIEGRADAVFGSRMMNHGALKGGMPLYKYVGNRILTTFQNFVLGSGLSEFHSGYRVYSVPALAGIQFEANTNVFHFDTEIIIQLMCFGMRIHEVPIPTYYGDEICHVNGLKYAWDVVRVTLHSRAVRLGIFHDRKFEPRHGAGANELYQPKLDFESPHTLALARVPDGARVLDVGCASGYVAQALSRRSCRVSGVDMYPLAPGVKLERFIRQDLDHPLDIDISDFDRVLLLDVIEHLRAPESFLEALRTRATRRTNTKMIISTGNVAFFAVRLMLLAGWFNYGKRGILDMTHTRLFTFASMAHLLEQCGYQVEEVRGVPAPFRLALGDGALARAMLAVNRALIKLSRGLFSYQIFMVATPRPSIDALLEAAHQEAGDRKASAQATYAY